MLWLPPEQARQLIDAARQGAPAEVCGLLLGRDGRIDAIVPAENIDADPETGYAIAPEVLATTLTGALRRGQQLIGIYHSHPASPPIPSARDIREAHYPDAVHLIIGLAGAEPALAAWHIRAGRVTRAALWLHADRPLPRDAEPTVLTPVQRLAVITAGLIAVAAVLAIAFSVLPPPEIPS